MGGGGSRRQTIKNINVLRLWTTIFDRLDHSKRSKPSKPSKPFKPPNPSNPLSTKNPSSPPKTSDLRTFGENVQITEILQKWPRWQGRVTNLSTPPNSSWDLSRTLKTLTTLSCFQKSSKPFKPAKRSKPYKHSKPFNPLKQSEQIS